MLAPGPRRGPSPAQQQADGFYPDAPQAQQGLRNYSSPVGFMAADRVQHTPSPMQQLGELPSEGNRIGGGSRGGSVREGYQMTTQDPVPHRGGGGGGGNLEVGEGGPRDSRVTSDVYGVDDGNG